ncbi:MAG: hypothetical protein ACK4ND_13055 [Cytophagaceae bacterium]
MSKNAILVLVNTVSLLAVLAINYLSNTGVLGTDSVGDVSRRYDTLFAPAGYAFSIWGIIYLLLIAFTIYQWYILLKSTKSDIIRNTGLWFSLANIANALWVLAWVNEYIGLSVILMALLLFSLIMLVYRLDLEMWDAPRSVIVLVWWPFTIYFGWIVLATVANISAFLVSFGWDGSPLSAELWTIVLIAVACFIYLLLIYFRNMREAAMVGVWGLVAITVRQWDSTNSIAISAVLAALILFLSTAWHSYKNRKSSPFMMN